MSPSPGPRAKTSSKGHLPSPLRPLKHSPSPPLRGPLKNSSSPPLRGRCRRQRGVSLSHHLSGRWRRTPPLSLRDISPRKGGRGDPRVFQRSPCGGDAEGRGGSPHLVAYLVAGGGPPLCHSVTSPPARGGEETCEFFEGLRKGAGGEGTVAFSRRASRSGGRGRCRIRARMHRSFGCCCSRAVAGASIRAPHGCLPVNRWSPLFRA